MPRKSIDYSKCLIYKLCCNDPLIKDEYYGHTTDKIRRKREHKIGCINPNNRSYNFYIYEFIRENGGWENWSMIVVEEYPCENVNQSKLRERYWIETQQATLNKQIPTRTKQETNDAYYQQNKNKIKETIKQYTNQHRVQYNEYHKQYQKKKYLYDKQCEIFRNILL